jgi:hypothetical protein
MSTVGSLSWAERTGGRLTNREALAFLLNGMRAQVASMPSRVAYTLGIRRQLSFDLDDIPIPDSAAAQDAAEICGELPDHLAAHSHRTYLWGMMLARIDGMTPDPELAWVASLTHDAGIGPAVSNGDETCFTLRSAAVTREVGERAGWSEARTRAAQHAVTMHFNMGVPASEPAEARLVNAGAAVDVASHHRWEFGRETVAAVLARHPRYSLEHRFADLLDQHMRQAPRTRCGVICRYGGFKLLVRRSHP